MSMNDRWSRWTGVRWSAALAAISVLAATASAVDAVATDVAARRGATVACINGAVSHPIEVRVRPLDPIRRGASMRLEVRATARTPLAGAEMRLVSPGGTIVAGATRLALGRLVPQREVVGTFRVTVPDQGHRFLVQFVVSGEGSTGPLARGAVYNLLPDGPVDPGRQLTTADGARIHEFAAARSAR